MPVDVYEEKLLTEIAIKASDIAKETKSKILLPEHFLSVILQDKFIVNLLTKKDAEKYENVVKMLNDFCMNSNDIDRITDEDSSDELIISPLISIYISYVTVCNKSCLDILSKNKDFYKINLLGAFLFMHSTYANKVLRDNGFDVNYIDETVENLASNIIFDDRIKPLLEEKTSNTKNDTNFEEEYLNAFTINLTNKVKQKDWIHIVGRNEEIDLIKQILLRKDKPNVILVGYSGVGKTKIVEGIAFDYIKKHPEITFLQLDTLSLFSNIGIKGELENRIKNIYNIISKKGNIILFIDEIHSICNSSNNASQPDVANLLKPLLTDGKLKIIGATTFEEYRKYMENDEAFTRRFYKMIINEPSIDETRKIIAQISTKYEEFYHIKYLRRARETILDLTKKYIFDKHFPEKAIDVLDMAGAYCKYIDNSVCDVLEIQKTISRMLNIPLSNISQSEEDIYQHLEDNLKKEIIGQDEAVNQVSDAVIIARSGLREANKTATSLMFKGSSGVGKTEICKVLSKIMNIPLVRFDMSEFMEEHSVPKLIGAPPGYKDAGDGKAGNGLLINAIDENPYCILLLDEIEKAHPKIHNLLLQVMDNGKLTSSMGKSVSFENVFLIMTSNVGSYNSHKIGIGFGNSETSPSDKDFEDSFLPEFRNRIDSVITFNTLPESVMKKICKKFLNELKDMLRNKKIDFKYNDDIINYIVSKVGSSENGARPMKHIITNEIKNKIAKNLVFGKYKENSIINLTMNENIINFEVEEKCLKED